jgi:hypothetical protein
MVPVFMNSIYLLDDDDLPQAILDFKGAQVYPSIAPHKH